MARAAAAAKPDPKAIEGQFSDTPEGWARYWQIEFKAARDEQGEDWPGISSWHEQGARIVRRYRAKKKARGVTNDARINIFPSNIQTQRAILVGNTPKCEVSRRYDDPSDDVARIAADMLERVLNAGLEEEGKGFAAVIARCTEDRLLPGMCGSRVQFACDFEPVPEQPEKTAPCPACMGSGVAAEPPPAPEPLLNGDESAYDHDAPPPGSLADPIGPGEPMPCQDCQGSGVRVLAAAVPASEKPVNESADAVYQHWRDQLWNAGRTFDEVRWWAFAADMSRKDLREAFGDEGAAVPLNAGKNAKGKGKDGGRIESPWARARVWEIWSKEHQRVFFFVEGHPRVLFHVDNPAGEDPLGLDDFWPFPRPMLANAVSDAYLPTPDFKYAEDLYDEADDLTARIRGIVKAIKVAGVYDQSSGALRRLLDEACELELIPVANWSAFLKDKGGLSGAVQFLPIADMVQVVVQLVAQRNLVIEQIFQITGLGDIIRGQQMQSETATTSAIKARFASVRLQDLQKEVARYATDLQRLRKEVVAKHWTVETIIERSSIMLSEDGRTPDGQQKILAAAKLIKDRHLDFRVVIKPEQISLQDWAQLKQQRTEVLASVGTHFASMAPVVQLLAPAGPEAVQAVLEFTTRTGQALVAGMPGTSGIESAFDTLAQKIEKIAQKALAAQQAAAAQPKPPPPPDPKVQVAGIKAQGDIAKARAATQGRLVEIAAETRAAMAQRAHDAQLDVATTEAQERVKGAAAVAEVLDPGRLVAP